MKNSAISAVFAIVAVATLIGAVAEAAYHGSPPLLVPNGGTNAIALTGHGMVVMNSGGTAAATLAPGVSNNCAVSNGTDWTATTCPAGSAVDTVTSGISAAGTTQGTATAVNSVIGVITTCAAGAGVVDGVTPTAGGHKVIINNSANPCIYYPISGATINGFAANTGVYISVGALADFRTPTTSTYWGQ